MRIAVFSDIHGNYLNLVSFFQSARKLNIDKYVCLGDLLNYFPDNKKVIDLLVQEKVLCLLGNHDRMYIEDCDKVEKKKLYNFDQYLFESEEYRIYLESLPLKYEIVVKNRSLFFCHASPLDYLDTYVYPDSDLSTLNSIKADFVFMGHTHRQFLREYNNKVFCNVGSIGMPRDNGILMGFVIIDTTAFDIKLYRKNADYQKIISSYQSQTNPDVINLLNRRETISYPYTLIHE